jgi:uncharacterized membrane protein (DUF485 family)
MSEALALPNKENVSAALKRRFFLRLHMTFILGATFAAGLMTTKLLLAIHLNNLGVRYAIAVCAAFAVFLGFIKLWLAYVGYLALRKSWGDSIDFTSDGVNVPLGGGGSGGGGAVPSFSGGGGSGGGGGATGSWGTPSSSSSGGGGSGSKFDLDFGDDWGVIILIALLVLAILLASVYVIYAAPAILSEAAFNAALAGALARRTRHVSSGGWVGSVFRATVLPFLAVLTLATATGWYAHKHCPSATRLREAVSCATTR